MKWLNTLLYDDWKSKLRKGWNLYQRAWFYDNIFWTEVKKPLRLEDNLTRWLTLLGVYGLVFGFKEIGLIVISLVVVGIVGGKILVKTGVMKYNQKLGNEQNEELMEVVKWVREQKKNAEINAPNKEN